MAEYTNYGTRDANEAYLIEIALHVGARMYKLPVGEAACDNVLVCPPDGRKELVEIKINKKVKLTPNEKEFWVKVARVGGDVHRIETADQLIDLIGVSLSDLTIQQLIGLGQSDILKQYSYFTDVQDFLIKVGDEIDRKNEGG